MSKPVKINLQQITKASEVMECFLPPPGWVLVDTDIRSLEPCVVAHFSRDPAHLELFASGKLHDVYLYVAMALFPERRAEIAAVYYDVDGTSTSRATLDAAKAAFKFERKVAKPLHLSAGYGASAGRMYGAMVLQGVEVTLDQVRDMRTKYWQLFAGVKAWEQQLLREREDRGGWVYNGFGRPLAITDDKLKDIVNTFAQSTGHDALLKLVHHAVCLRRERGVHMIPWIPDMHDQTTWCCPADQAETAAQVLRDAYVRLNAELGSDIPLTGSVDGATNLWQLKEG